MSLTVMVIVISCIYQLWTTIISIDVASPCIRISVDYLNFCLNNTSEFLTSTFQLQPPPTPPFSNIHNSSFSLTGIFNPSGTGFLTSSLWNRFPHLISLEQVFSPHLSGTGFLISFLWNKYSHLISLGQVSSPHFSETKFLIPFLGTNFLISSPEQMSFSPRSLYPPLSHLKLVSFPLLSGTVQVSLPLLSFYAINPNVYHSNSCAMIIISPFNRFARGGSTDKSNFVVSAMSNPAHNRSIKTEGAPLYPLTGAPLYPLTGTPLSPLTGTPLFPLTGTDLKHPPSLHDLDRHHVLSSVLQIGNIRESYPLEHPLLGVLNILSLESGTSSPHSSESGTSSPQDPEHPRVLMGAGTEPVYLVPRLHNSSLGAPTQMDWVHTPAPTSNYNPLNTWLTTVD
uniref:Putative secretory peptide-13 n=1 Tax=Pleurobrachia bachei TaxID=34499 RepID=M4H1Q6_PLEBA|nr:putative secretory peptide-13 [Pleurobrachia bachei]|eukprot:sb/3465427/